MQILKCKSTALTCISASKIVKLFFDRYIVN